VVEVGAQVNGRIVEFGPDPTDPSKPIDYGSIVREGTILARIDPTIYMAQVDQAKAALLRAKADVLQLEAKCDQAKQEWKRAQTLLPEKAIADSDYDLMDTNFRVSKANLAIGQAAVQQCEAALCVAKTYLNYTVIKSPIDGVVLDRRVNVGQTVVAAFNVPGLFIIAKDLRRVQVWASIDESDIGGIHPNQHVQFTMNAYPGEVFSGRVTQIRLNPVMVKGRTTYTVVVATKNKHGILPYLTAKLRLETQIGPLAHSTAADPLAEWRSAAKPTPPVKAPNQWANGPNGLPNRPGNKNSLLPHGSSTPPKKPIHAKPAAGGVAAG
jgi:HlyD family secretion protein